MALLKLHNRSRDIFGVDTNLRNTDNRTNNKRSHFRTVVVSHQQIKWYPQTQKKGYNGVSFCGYYSRNGHFCPTITAHKL